MTVYSDHKLPVFQVLGPIVRVHWDYESYITEEQTQAWRCQEAVVSVNATREQFVKTVNEAGGQGEQLADEYFNS